MTQREFYHYNILFVHQEFYLNKKNKDFLISIIEEILSKSIHHFTCEEIFMQKIKFEGYYSHKLEHDRAIRKIKEFLKKFDKISEIENFTIFLKNWFTNHLELKDKNLGIQLNQNEIF